VEVAVKIVPTLRNIWWMAMWSQDLVPGKMLSRRIMDEPLVFYRTESGKPAAVHDRCPHRWAPLSKGKLLPGDHLQCPYHGLEFDQHGVCVKNPHPNYKIPSTMRVRSYPLAEKHSAIWIWMGTGTPDESLIPDFSWLDPDSPHPIDRRNYLPMPAAWHLMVDNLLDTSHVATLHDTNLGVPEMIDADTIVEQTGPRSITVKREFSDLPVSMFFDLLMFGKHKRVDLYAYMSWSAPSCLTNNGWAKPPGAPMEQATGMQSCHFLTPETETTCHYHFAAMRFQPIRGTPEQEAEVMRQMADIRQQAFVEQDGVIITAQQARIQEAIANGEDLRPTLISADHGIERAHRILFELHEEEQKEPVSAR
jgi:phenylpropionate dioxygenase-like ring-hydroxylating dioxygenase large terminal subunit